MAEQRTVRIGFVGVGTMGQCAHLRNYATLPDCEVVAIAEPREDVGRKVAARYQIPKVYRTHEEMFAAEKLDGIVAAQPFTRHGAFIPEILKARVPVFIEKPIAASISMGERIVQAVKENGSFLMVGYHKRCDPATMWAKKEIDALKKSGEIGKLRYVRILMPAGDWVAGGLYDLVQGAAHQPAFGPDPRPSDMDEELYDSYVAFVNYYIHQVNLMRHLLGEPYSLKYAAASGVMLAGESRSGVACVLEMSPYETTLDWQESALVAFEHGWVRLDLPAPLAMFRAGSVEIFKDPSRDATPQRISPQFPSVHAMRQQAINFIRAVRGEMPPMTGAAEALEDLRVARQYIRLWKGR
ncbi:MAG: Gfo/Idh/MocA family oxidoreductase [Candidatus Brocadiia bacterium]|jgi:predicted dehydrogenase